MRVGCLTRSHYADSFPSLRVHDAGKDGPNGLPYPLAAVHINIPLDHRLAWPLHKDDMLFQSGRPTGLNIYFTSHLYFLCSYSPANTIGYKYLTAVQHAYHGLHQVPKGITLISLFSVSIVLSVVEISEVAAPDPFPASINNGCRCRPLFCTAP
jgi:hypothetical protein